ncbi:tetratricopeptide repeat protein [Aurantiacibacter gilvus]|uniref:Tetratricopeptide repeat protein n=1 Tax=Aurantiacibacter gilvus TaxID=3139141 RepID=A0ABU9ICS2_9SPHN
MKKHIALVTIGAMALALSACGVSPEEQFDRAEQAFAEHRFNDARLDLGTLLQADSDNPELLELMARTQLQLGDGEGARSMLERLAAQNVRPDDYDTLLAEAMLLQGEFESALAAGTALGTAEGYRIAALSHVALGGADAALESFQQGMQAAGDRSRLYADFARFAHMAGETGRAVELARMAREADPQGLDPLLASALIAQDSGRYEQALEYYEQAQAAWPESRVALLGRIGVLGDSGRLDDARTLIEEAARQQPDDPDVIYLQARLAAEEGDWSDVRTILQPIEDNSDPRQQLLYARALVELDLVEQALPRLTTLVRRNPAVAEPRRVLARAQLAAGNAAAAFDTIQPLAVSPESSPSDLALYAEAARASGRTGQIDRALAEAPPEERVATLMAEADSHMRNERWRAAIDTYEDLRGWTGDSNAMVLNNLAFAKSRIGAEDEALDLAVRALALAPEQPNVMDTAGWLMVQTGRDRARGIELLERAAELAPGNEAIAEHLAAARRG